MLTNTYLTDKAYWTTQIFKWFSLSSLDNYNTCMQVINHVLFIWVEGSEFWRVFHPQESYRTELSSLGSHWSIKIYNKRNNTNHSSAAA